VPRALGRSYLCQGHAAISHRVVTGQRGKVHDAIRAMEGRGGAASPKAIAHLASPQEALHATLTPQQDRPQHNKDLWLSPRGFRASFCILDRYAISGLPPVVPASLQAQPRLRRLNMSTPSQGQHCLPGLLFHETCWPTRKAPEPSAFPCVSGQAGAMRLFLNPPDGQVRDRPRAGVTSMTFKPHIARGAPDSSFPESGIWVPISLKGMDQ
jgi:hypothetical protein